MLTRKWSGLWLFLCALVALGFIASAANEPDEWNIAIENAPSIDVRGADCANCDDIDQEIIRLWGKYTRLSEEEEAVWASGRIDRFTTSDLLAIKSSILHELVSLIGKHGLLDSGAAIRLAIGMESLIKGELNLYVAELIGLNPNDVILRSELLRLQQKIVTLIEEEERVLRSGDGYRYGTSILLPLKTCILGELHVLRGGVFVGVQAIDAMIQAVEALIKVESLWHLFELWWANYMF